MREVLFRGKRADYGEWIEGYYAKQSNHACFAHELKYQHFIFKDVCLDFNLGGLQGFEIIPETVGQYTGLKDKNGKKIFEGDIVRLTDEHNEIEWTAVVVFGNPNGEYNWGWQLKAIGEFDGNKDILLWVDMEESGAYFEIIGNIHDNPELLKGGEGNG